MRRAAGREARRLASAASTGHAIGQPETHLQPRPNVRILDRSRSEVHHVLRTLRHSTAALLAATAASVAVAQPNRDRVALTHVTIIDVETGARRRDQTVILADGRIAAVGASASLESPAGTRRVNGRGKFLIPGLWDMHAHTYRSLNIVPALYLANGVTGIRDMGSRIGVQPVLALRDSIRAGLVRGPRMVVGGMVSNLTPGIDSTSATTVTPATARAIVDSLARLGVDFIKVVQLTPATFFAVVTAAHANGLHFAGHLPWGVDLRVASDSGMLSHEHLWGILTACSTTEDSLRSVIADRPGPPEAPRDDSRVEGRFVSALTARRDWAKCDALFQRVARNGTFVEPTLLVARELGWPREFAHANDPRLRYVHSGERERWLRVHSAPPWTIDAPGNRALFTAYADLVRRIGATDVRLLAGSDAGYPFVYHGFSLHDELATLVAAGLTPLRALQTATLNPARYLGATDSLGTVAAGKVADLVLLDADPLADIHNTTRIQAVVANGRYLDRDALDRLLRGAATTAAGNGPSPASHAEQEVRQIDGEFNAAMGGNDTAALDRIFADDCVFINERGAIFGKLHRVDVTRSGKVVYQSYQSDDVKVRLYGDAAVVTERGATKGSDPHHTGQFQYTRVYVKRGGRWQLVAAHKTRIAPPPPPAVVTAPDPRSIAPMTRADSGSATQPTPRSIAEAEIRTMRERARQAWLHGDVATIDALWADDCVSVSSWGAPSTKAQVLARMRQGLSKFLSLTYDQVNVQVHGNAAVETGRVRYSFIPAPGKSPLSGEGRYTLVFAAQPTGWRVVSHQVSNIAPDLSGGARPPGP
ncbi:MAG: hypothetical protein NVS9B3_05770 [Gemmatimonadaceae bacterium]